VKRATGDGQRKKKGTDQELVLGSLKGRSEKKDQKKNLSLKKSA